MRTFVLVYFWLMIAITAVRIMEMAIREWPVKREPKSLGLAVAETVSGLGFAIWAAIVLFR